MWTVLTPRLTVTTMNLTASSSVSTKAKSGIRYDAMPVLTQAQKDSAKEASDATLAQGVRSAALGPYVPRGSALWFLGGSSVVQSFTGVLGRPFRSRRRFFFTLGCLGVLYTVLLVFGIIDAIGMFAVGAYNWGLITWDTYWEGYENLVVFTSAVTEWAQRYQVGVREAGVLAAPVLAIVLGGQCGMSSDESDSEMGSGASTPGPASLSLLRPWRCRGKPRRPFWCLRQRPFRISVSVK